MTNSLVSICIPTYNGEKYLQEALDSVKAQTYKNIEVIISDDVSKDRTLEICERFKNEVNFPVYIYHHQPAGIGANWNNCIEKASGEYIQFLFQDDILHPICIEEKLKYLKQNNLKAVCCKREIIDENGSPVTTGRWYETCYDPKKTFEELFTGMQPQIFLESQSRLCSIVLYLKNWGILAQHLNRFLILNLDIGY